MPSGSNGGTVEETGGPGRWTETMAGEVDPARLMDAMADPVVVIGADARLLYANAPAEARFGWSVAEMQRDGIDRLVHPDDLETALLSLVSVTAKEVGTLVEIRLRDRTELYSWFEVRGRVWPDGPAGAVVLNLRESTDRRQWEVSGGDADLLGAVLDHLPVVAMVLDGDGRVRGANRALTRMLHRDLENVRGAPLTNLVAPEERDAVGHRLAAAATASAPTELEAHLVRADGSQVPMRLQVVNLLDDRAVQGLVVTASDITSLVDVRADLRRLATTDDLTGLPNRADLREHLEVVLADGEATSHTVLFGDVDGLKAVNDHHGHRAGDALLATVAQRLRAAVRPSDFVARLSGDEFVIVVATDDAKAIRTLRQRIAGAMADPVVLPDGQRVHVSISVGVAAVEPGLTVEDLLAAADAAMYVAKRERDEHA